MVKTVAMSPGLRMIPERDTNRARQNYRS